MELNNEELAVCNWGKDDCFGHAGCEKDKCNCLNNTEFPTRKMCPFYKSLEQYQAENPEEK